MICGKLIRTFENSNQPCLCEKDHEGGCNPFSANPYIPLDKSMATPRVIMEKIIQNIAKEEKVSLRCLWQGANGRCVKPLGHFPATDHKEDLGK
jgi:hypothetical protein